MTRIGIVVAHPDFFSAVDPDRDAAPLVAALRARGVDASSLVWTDPEVVWEAYDLVVIRSPWDYPDRPAAFVAWLDRVGALTTILNPPELVLWNMDKHYLGQLEDAGIATVPTSWHDRADGLALALAGAPEHVVLKPAVGAGAQSTGLFRRDDPAALALGREILATRRTVMLQPEVPELSEGRETALYALDGAYTHAIAKGALLARGGGVLGGQYQERPVVVDASADERAFAEDVLAAIDEVTGQGTPLYARIDVVDSAEHGLVLLEAELFEPTFNLHLAPQVTDLFADAILARAGGAGG